MISTHISRVSACLLLAGGLALLFAADDILPRLVPGFPAGGAWLGQLLGAAWLGLAALDWYGGANLLGGIYGRPIVLANAAVYFISALVLVKVLMNGQVASLLLLLTAPVVLLAATYTWLLFRGPFAADLLKYRG